MSTFQNSPGKAPNNATCFRCGKVGHLASECWSKELVCRSCGKKGHTERACRGKQKAAKQKFSKMPGTTKNKKNVYTMQSKCKYTDDTDSSSEEVPLKILAVEGDSKGYWVTPVIEGDRHWCCCFYCVRCCVPQNPKTCLLEALQDSVENIYRGACDIKRGNGCGSGIKWSVSNAATVCGKRELPSFTWMRMMETIKLDWPTVRMVSRETRSSGKF